MIANGSGSELTSFLKAIILKYNLQIPFREEAAVGYAFTILTYILVLIGFGAICLITALFQNHFRLAQKQQYESEIEARDLRIQMLESNLKTLDLKLEILDQDYERAVASANKARKTIDKLEAKLVVKSYNNEELLEKLEKAHLKQGEAEGLVRSIEEDRKRIAADRRSLKVNLEEEERLYVDLDRYAVKHPRLNSFWLNSLYKNIFFSRKALKNLAELQNIPQVFPSLPEALSSINSTILDSIMKKDKIPPKSITSYNTQQLNNVKGPLWEYRFSRDGRIFFGLSKKKTWNIDMIVLKRHLPDTIQKYDKYLADTLGKDNDDLINYT
jgi:cell division protein FtsB